MTARKREAGALDVAALYRDLVLTRLREVQQAPLFSSGNYGTDPAHFAETADLLIEAAAHLKVAADLIGREGSRGLQLVALADEVVVEAAAFAHTADSLAAGARGTGRR